MSESNVSQTLLATNRAKVMELTFEGTVISTVAAWAKIKFLGALPLVLTVCAGTVKAGFGKLREVGRSGPRSQGKGTNNRFVGGN